MPEPATVTRTDLILWAITQEVERWRPVINGDRPLQSLVVTVHLSAGGGHPRSVECHVKSENRIPAPVNSA